MANKDILTIDISTTSSNNDYVYVYQDGAFVRVQKSKFLENSVSKSQGTSNAGKFLVVGSDGNVTTRTLTAWQGGSY